MKTYGVGIIGCGSVWEKSHKLVFSNSDRLKCVCIYDLNAERAKEAAELTGARVAGSAEEVLRANDVDIVSILTPAVTHADLVEIGAEAGKHFMIEKPIAANMDDAIRIANAIRNAGVHCFHPTLRALASDLFTKLKELTMPDGLLGKVRGGFHSLLGRPFPWAPWVQDRKLCVPYAEYGSHVFDTFLALVEDEPESVRCQADRYFSQADQDDVIHIAVRFPSGHYFQMNINWVLKDEWNYRRHDFHLVCERGVIAHSWFGAEWHSAEGKDTYESPRRATQGYRWEHYETLADAIETGVKCSPNEEDALKYMRIVDAASQSSRSGNWERVTKVVDA